MHYYGTKHASDIRALQSMSSRERNSLQLPSEVDEDPDEDETGDSENGDDGEKKAGGNVGRFVTLQSLLGAGVLEPGEGAMTIDYLGQKFTGDLLLDGKIKSQETDKIYASPTAWAVSCKKIINPVKQSGCGWATVRYKGKKLDAYKNIWIKKQYEEGSAAYDFLEAFSKSMIQPESEVPEQDAPALSLEDPRDPELADVKQRVVVKHNVLGNRQPTHDQNMLVESVTFASLGKIQPFLISFATNAALVIDLHSHLTTSEVVGYLAGTWDVNSHVLTVSHAFPVRCRLGDFDAAPVVEAETLQMIRSHGLTLLGWYHSHPSDPATPSLRDIDTQLDYELRMKGTTDSAYLPCVGLICSPYNRFNASMESQMVFYWVAPPPESRIHEYGKPMTMNHAVHQDEGISHEVLMEIKKCVDFYKHDSDFVVFDNAYKKGVTFLEKLKMSASGKFPRNLEKCEDLWNCLRSMVLSTSDEPDTALLKEMLAVSNTPCASPDPEKPKLTLPALPALSSLAPLVLPAAKSPRCSPTPHAPRRRRSSREAAKPLPSLSNYFVGADLANALFSASMGLDPATLSFLNLNSLGLGGMFMPPMTAFKPDPGVGLMKPPPPPSPYYPYASSRGSRSRSSSSSPSSIHRNSPSSTVTKDMPPPNKVPKLENNCSAANNSKHCSADQPPSENDVHK